MIIPYYYQVDCNNALFDYFEHNTGNPLCALPTGTGKSVCISMFIMNAFHIYPHQKMLVLTHVKELIVQDFKELLGMWPNAPAGINSASLKQRDYNKKIIFAGIASVAKDYAKFGKIDLIIIDEAHLVNPTEETMYRKFLYELKKINPALKVIGFTATPYRAGHGLITENGIFTDMCYDITDMHSFNKLIAEGYLAPLIPKQTKLVLDTTGVQIGSDGDYKKDQLQIAVDRYEVTVEALKEAMELGYDRKHWLIFGSGVEHCDHIAEILNEMEISCRAVHSKIKERDLYIEEFKSGKVQCIVNNNILTTGFNFRAIDFIVVLRPTTSVVLWVQLLGRGTRTSVETGKINCLVADFAGNTQRLGPINDPVIPKKKGEKSGEAPVRTCDVCHTINHASARFCVCCGTIFKMAVKIHMEASTTELIKGELPIVEKFKIDHITYSYHSKLGGNPSLKVSYFSNLRVFSEYICVEHPEKTFPKNKANNWWNERAGTISPNDVRAALYMTDSLKKPSHLNIWTNKKYPEIMKALYEGDEPEAKTIEEPLQEYDDLIPFETKKSDPFNVGGAIYLDDSEIPF